MSDLITKVVGAFRWLIWWIDSIGFAFIDNAYEFMLSTMKGFNSEVFEDITGNLIQNAYLIVGIFALFRIAIALVNSIVNPDKLTDKKEGVGNILFHFVGAIILFIAVPLIFDLSRELQTIIVDGNYIPKLITGSDVDISHNNKAGEAMQLITLKALVRPDDEVADLKGGQYVPKETICAGNVECEAAVTAWNENRLKTVNISNYISSYVEVGDDNVYVYHYLPFITLAIGLFMTYVLLSFTIDIAVRSVELVVLEVLSPIFIVTFVDPKMASSGPFSKWLKACTKSYLTLFIRVGIISLMLLLIANIDGLTKGIDPDSEHKFWLPVLMIIAILIFAKKAPKWIGGMFGLDDGAGLGGLGIGKKLAGAALVGGGLSKAGRGIAGSVNAARRGVGNTIRSRKAEKKEAYKTAGLGNTTMERHKKRKELSEANGGSYFAGRKALREAKNNARAQAEMGGVGTALKQAGVGVLQGALAFKGAAKADSLKGALHAGKESADKFKVTQGMYGKTLGEKIEQKMAATVSKATRSAYGGGEEMVDREKTIKDRKTFENCVVQSRNTALRPGDIPFGEKGFVNSFAGSPDAYNDSLAAAALINKLRQSNVGSDINKFSIDCSGNSVKVTAKLKDGSDRVESVSRGGTEYQDAQTSGAALFQKEGIYRLQDNAVALQQASVSNTQAANQKVNELSQANDAAQQTLLYNDQKIRQAEADMNNMSSKMQTALEKAFRALPADALASLKLNPGDLSKKTLKELEMIMKDANDKGIKVEDKEYQDAKEAYNTAARDKETSEKAKSNASDVIKINSDNMQAYMQFIEKWKPTYEKVSGTTYDEKSQLLEKDRKKSSDIVKKYEEEKNKD